MTYSLREEPLSRKFTYDVQACLCRFRLSSIDANFLTSTTSRKVYNDFRGEDVRGLLVVL